jgi:hypothetical protein
MYAIHTDVEMADGAAHVGEMGGKRARASDFLD